jgi:hypothetical protein
MTTKNYHSARRVKSVFALTVSAGLLAMALPAFGQALDTKKIILTPPDTTVNEHLKPNDLDIKVLTVSSNPWVCSPKSNALEEYSKDVEKLWQTWGMPGTNLSGKTNQSVARGQFVFFVRIIQRIKSKSPIEFWNDPNLSSGSGFATMPDTLLNPLQGKKVSKGYENCYSLQELAAGQREAVRWANYMKNIWLPTHKAGK